MQTQMKTASHPKDVDLFNYLSHGGAIYPNVHIPTDQYKPELLNKDQILLHQRDERTLSQTLYQHYAPQTVKNLCGTVSNLYQRMVERTELCAHYFTPLQMLVRSRVPEDTYGPEPTTKVDFEKLPARTLDWHSSNFKLAVTLQDQSVYFYDVLQEQWSPQVLQHEFHRDVRVCRYKPGPIDQSVLAVGTRHGICLWDTTQRLTPLLQQHASRQPKDQTQYGACIFLKTSAPVTTLDWFPARNQVLTETMLSHEVSDLDQISQDTFVSASEHDHRVFIWQLMPRPIITHSDYEQNENLQQVWNHDWRCVRVLNKWNGGIKAVSFSPNGHLLAVFTNSNVFHIYETRGWTSERWSCFDAPVSAHCWSANGEFLILSTVGGTILHILQFGNKPPRIDGQHITKIPLHYMPAVQLCGVIREIALDHEGGERLVVSFEDCNMLAVMRCNFEMVGARMTCLPLGFIKGPLESRSAHHLKFWPNFKKGALLSVVWDTGKLSFYPFYYVDQNVGWNRSISITDKYK
ncbi:aladin [Acrasis kona]|uniref:Aladin n=1 Tax=Acrasis kona TaxID=1008807 RepID=A0AAW2ZPG6_9EUKA